MSDDRLVPVTDPLVFGAWFEHHADVNDPKAFEIPWSEFVAIATGSLHARDEKKALDGTAPGFSLAHFVPKLLNTDKGKIIARKRVNICVDVLSGLVFDFDKDYDPTLLFERLDNGLAWLAYTTFTHEPTTPKWRVVVPTSVPIPAPAYVNVRQWFLASMLNKGSGMKLQDDESAKAVSRFYYLPGCPERNAVHAEWRVSHGPALEPPPLVQLRSGFPPPRALGTKIDWAWLKARMGDYRKDKGLRKAFKKVLEGSPFAEPGERDQTLMRLCGVLAGWALQAEPEQLAELFRNSLQIMTEQSPDDPPADLDNVADKIARAQASLVGQTREQSEMAVASAQTIERQTTQPEAAFAADALAVGLPDADALRRRLLLRHRDAIYLWRTDLRTWGEPLGDAALAASARLVLGDVPGVETWTRKTDGGLRGKTAHELFFDHGEVIDGVTMRLDVNQASYDLTKRILTLPGAKRRALQPEANDFVAKWLRALGGDRYGLLLDWIAGLTWHDRPNSVLFLQGDEGVGKGLLVRGLSRVWECDGATNFRRIVGDFNDDLLRCPLVHIDEGKWARNVDATALLREHVTQQSRTINGKYQRHVEHSGHLRFVVTANNFNIFSNDQQSLTPTDRDAIAKRFLEITPDIEAQQILLSIEPDARDALAAADVIARHALWLGEHRHPARVSRFVVEGVIESRFAARIITEDRGWGSWVAEWLARYLTEPVQVERDQGHLVSRGGGRVLVSPEAVVNTFERVLKNKRPPQAVEISNTLKSLSTGELQPLPSGRGAGFEILVEEVAYFAEEKGIGSPVGIRANAQDAQRARAPASVVSFKPQGSQQ